MRNRSLAWFRPFHTRPDSVLVEQPVGCADRRLVRVGLSMRPRSVRSSASIAALARWRPEVEECVMESYGRSRVLPRMSASSRPRRAGGARRPQMFRLSSLAGQVTVDAGRRRLCIVGEHVSRHEADCVIASILSRHEAVDTFDNVLPTKIGAIPRDPFALDDRVRIVFVVFLADVAEEDRDVRTPVRSWATRTRARFRSRQDGHLSAPRGTFGRQSRSHPGSKLLRDLHLPGPPNAPAEMWMPSPSPRRESAESRHYVRR